MKFNIDKDWTLFLDRDGVINEDIDGSYVLSWEQFEFLPNVLEALKELSKKFKYIFVITNQQCVGKGLLSLAELKRIHQNMKTTIEENDGRIDGIYFAPDLQSPTNTLRKPNTGMPLLAKEQFKDIDFSKSVLVGDKDTDIEVGIRLGMKTAWIVNNNYKTERADMKLQSLLELVQL